MTKYKVYARYYFDIETDIEADNSEAAAISASLMPLGDWIVNEQGLEIDTVEEIA